MLMLILKISSKLVGDPLEMALLNAIQWTLEVNDDGRMIARPPQGILSHHFGNVRELSFVILTHFEFVPEKLRAGTKIFTVSSQFYPHDCSMYLSMRYIITAP